MFVYTHQHPAMEVNAARMQLGRTFPSFDLAQSNMGIALYAQGDLDGAIDANRQALALVASDADLLAQTRNNLRWALLEMAETDLAAGNVASAQAKAREAFQLEPTFLDALSNKATDALPTGNAAAAISKYHVAVLMTPAHAGARLNLALALGALGRTEEALAAAREAQQLAPW